MSGRPNPATLLPIFLFGVLLAVFAQPAPTPAPIPAYRFPMAGNEFLIAGTFGELRATHFHAGLDVKTGAEIGKPLYAVADGYVYQVRVSPYGFGNAVYLRHLDGSLSLYAHMNAFSPAIEEVVYQWQYTTKRFEQDIHLPESRIPVNAGDLIGYSGNSGSSQGPHLHLELRDADEQTLNPLPYFKSLIKDDVPPVVQAVAFEPLEMGARVQGRWEKLEVVPEGKNGQYKINDIVELQGRVGLEFQGYDLLSGAGNHCGINYVRLYLDGTLIYAYALERLGFEEKKFIHAYYDYAHYKRTNRRFERCYREPGNPLSAYRVVVDEGAISLHDTRLHAFRLELSDVHGNTTTVQGQVRQGTPAVLPNTVSFAGLTTLEGYMRRDVFVALLRNPSTGHLQGIDIVYPEDRTQRIRPSWFGTEGLYFLVDLRAEPLPVALRDPITGKTHPFHFRKMVDPERVHVVNEGELQAYFPIHATFDTMGLEVERMPGGYGSCSDIYAIGNPQIPLRTPFVVTMDPSRPVRKEHLVLARKDSQGRWRFLGNDTSEEGHLYASTDVFGTFCVMADSLAPEIRPLNFKQGGTIPGNQTTLTIFVDDDFAGIDAEKLHGTLDGNWILLAYDAKFNTLTHTFRERPAPGLHALELTAYDNANNMALARFSIQIQ